MTVLHGLLLIVVSSSLSFAGRSSQRLGLKVIKHAPCSTSPSGSGTWQPSIQFGSSKDTPFEAEHNKPGCYSMDGEVTVNKAVRGKLQVYVEVRTGPDSRVPPEECTNFNRWTGCGGYGSWPCRRCVKELPTRFSNTGNGCSAYCEDCSSLHKKDATIAKLTLTKNGRPLDCEAKNLEPGVYKDIKMSFCMPTERDFIEHTDLDRESWSAIRETQGDMVPAFLNIYTFEQLRGNIARAVTQQQYQIEMRMRQRDNRLDQLHRRRLVEMRNESPHNQPHAPILGLPLGLTIDDLYDMPVARLLRQDKHIACHRVYAQMYFDSSDVPRDTRSSGAQTRLAGTPKHNVFKNG